MLAAILATMVALMGPKDDGSVRRYDRAEMLSLLERHRVQVLLEAGHSKTEVSALTGHSIATVKRVGREAAVSHIDDKAERRKRGVGRPSKADGYAERVRNWLKDEPDLPTQELLRLAMENGYTGKKSAFYAMAAALRPKAAAPVVRFEGLAGEFSQHDFGQVDVRFVDGRTKRVHFFVSRLKYSRYAAVTIVEDERVERLVRTLALHFTEFGGVPLLAVFDRPRTIVTKGGRGREVEQFNSTFAQAMLELGVGVEMCAPRSGNQKGSSEQLVKWVKNSFFKPRKFMDESDLEAQLANWVTDVNLRLPNRATGEIPETRRQRELARLRPVRVAPRDLALRVPVVVGPSATIMFEGVPYSMPARARNTVGTAFVYERRIVFVAGDHRAEHVRRRRSDGPAALPEHRREKLTAVRGARAKEYEMRQQVLDAAPSTETILTELRHAEPKRSREHVERLHGLLDVHGDGALRAAVDRVIASGTLAIDAVEHELLKKRGRERAAGPPAARSRPQPRGARGRTKRRRSGRAEQRGGSR